MRGDRRGRRGRARRRDVGRLRRRLLGRVQDDRRAPPRTPRARRRLRGRRARRPERRRWRGAAQLLGFGRRAREVEGARDEDVDAAGEGDRLGGDGERGVAGGDARASVGADESVVASAATRADARGAPGGRRRVDGVRRRGGRRGKPRGEARGRRGTVRARIRRRSDDATGRCPRVSDPRGEARLDPPARRAKTARGPLARDVRTRSVPADAGDVDMPRVRVCGGAWRHARSTE